MLEGLHWNLELDTDATSEPISIDDVKSFGRIDHAHEDGLIEEEIKAAVRYSQNANGRQYINATRILRLDKLPRLIEVPYSPLSSVTSLAYVDTAGDTQTLVENTDFTVDSKTEPARIIETYNTTYPATRSVMNAVTLTYVSGYGATASAVPVGLRRMLVQLVILRLRHRGIVTDERVAEVPYTFAAALQQEQVFDFG